MSYKIRKQLKSGFYELVSLCDKPKLDIVVNQVVGYITMDETISKEVFNHVLYIYPDWIVCEKIKVYNNPELFGEYLFSGYVDALVVAREKQYGIICCKPGIIKNEHI